MKIHKLKSLIAIVIAAFLISACGGSSKADEIKVFTGKPLGYETDESLDDLVNIPEETEEADEDADEDESEEEDVEEEEEDEETVEEPEEDTEPTIEEEEPTEMSSVSSDEAEEATETSEPEEVTVEERLLIDQNGVKITVTGMTSSDTGPRLSFLIENDTDKNLTVQAMNASVNGSVVDTMMSAEVAAMENANAELTFPSQTLSENGITTVTDMEFSFHVFETDGNAPYFDSDVVRVETSAMGSSAQNKENQ